MQQPDWEENVLKRRTSFLGTQCCVLVSRDREHTADPDDVGMLLDAFTQALSEIGAMDTQRMLYGEHLVAYGTLQN